MDSRPVLSPFINSHPGGVYSMYPSPVLATSEATLTNQQQSAHFCENKCNKYFWGCCCSTAGLLFLAFLLGAIFPSLGLLLAAVAPAVIILMFVQRYYAEQITIGQMTGMCTIYLPNYIYNISYIFQFLLLKQLFG